MTGALAAALAAALIALPSSAATLAELAEAAAARSAGREAMSARAREADAAAREARLRRLPAVTARVTATRGDDPVYAFGSLLQQRAFTAQDFALDRLNRPGYRTNVKSALEAGVPLFTGFELETHERFARLSSEKARLAETGEAQRARYRATEAYLSAAAKRGAQRAARERIAAAEEDVAAARRLRERGLVLSSDYLAAEAVLEGLRAWESRLAGEAAAHVAALAALTGRPAEELEPPAGLGAASYAPPPTEALARGAAGRPDAAAARLSVDAARAAERQARWSLAPRVEAFASVETNTRDLGDFPASRMVGARATLPFGDPGFFARRRRALEGVAAGEAERRRAAEEAALEVAQAHAAYEAAAASIPPLERMRDRAAESAAAFRPLYREGRQSVLEALRAHEATAKAEAAYLEAVAAAHAGYARLMLAAGALDAAPVAEISRSVEEAR